MPYHATFDADGLPTGYWQDGTVSPPDGSVSITDDQHEELVLNAGLRRWDGKDVVTYTPPAPPAGKRSASTYELMSVLTDAQRTAYVDAKPWDQRLFSARDTPWPETNEKIARIAVVIGTTPAAWFDAALGQA